MQSCLVVRMKQKYLLAEQRPLQPVTSSYLGPLHQCLPSPLLPLPQASAETVPDGCQPGVKQMESAAEFADSADEPRGRLAESALGAYEVMYLMEGLEGLLKPMMTEPAQPAEPVEQVVVAVVTLCSGFAGRGQTQDFEGDNPVVEWSSKHVPQLVAVADVPVAQLWHFALTGGEVAELAFASSVGGDRGVA